MKKNKASAIIINSENNSYYINKVAGVELYYNRYSENKIVNAEYWFEDGTLNIEGEKVRTIYFYGDEKIHRERLLEFIEEFEISEEDLVVKYEREIKFKKSFPFICLEKEGYYVLKNGGKVLKLRENEKFHLRTSEYTITYNES